MADYVQFTGGLAALMSSNGYDELVDDGPAVGGPWDGVICAAVSDASDTVTFTAAMERGADLTATLLPAGGALPGPFAAVTKTGGSGKLLLVRPIVPGEEPE